MLGPVGKGWSPEATREAPVERQQPISATLGDGNPKPQPTVES
jgi:hypothetical protein